MTKFDSIQVFCSYSHRDRDLRNELAKYLQLLHESLRIREWYDGEISAGQDWQREIKVHLKNSDVILLLVSIDFLHSSFVRKYEVPVALKRHRNGNALVIPVLLRPVPWKFSELSHLQALPKDLRPVVQWSPLDLAYVNICEGLFAAVLAWRGHGMPRQAVQARQSSNVRRRVLDLAISRQVPVSKPTFLTIMVRRVGERGLRAVLERDNRYGIRPDEVESGDSFPLEFPRRENGQLSPLDLTIEVTTGDFQCQDPRKNLSVPPRGDSAICVFLLEALRAGSVRLTVEVSYRGSIIRSHVLGSEGVASAAFEARVEEIPGFETPNDDEADVSSLQLWEAADIHAPMTRRRPRSLALILASLLLTFGALAWFANEYVKQSTQKKERKVPRLHPPHAPVAPPQAYQKPEREVTSAKVTGFAEFQGCVLEAGIDHKKSILTLKEIARGLGVYCYYDYAPEACEITTRWRFADEVYTKTETVETGQSLIVKDKYSGPLEPGTLTVSVNIIRKSTGKLAFPEWTTSVRLTR